MPVQQHILNWLYSVLTSEYHDVNRTYTDIANALSRFSSLAPRTDVHTFPNGTSALLLHLAGTLPVTFRGNVYRFPISIWLPHAYPHEPPLIYITPTDTMMIRPGQHVDPQGKVYHPYLVGWTECWDKSTLVDFLTILSEVFAKEPPVVARLQAATNLQGQERSHSFEPKSRPSLPGELRKPPPAPPPKAPHDDLAGQLSPSSVSQGLGSRPFSPPSLTQTNRNPSRYDSAPPLPGQHQAARYPDQLPPLAYEQAPLQQPWHPQPPQHRGDSFASSSQSKYAITHTHPADNRQIEDQRHFSGVSDHHARTSRVGLVMNRQTKPPQPLSPPADLLDGPLTLSIPVQSSMAAPPIPPNPEKDALLGQLAHTLFTMRQQTRGQDESSMAGLQAQRTAMLSTLPTLQSEMGQIGQLSSILSSNTAIVREGMHKADGVIEGSRRHPAPDIDELLVAPTMVSNQLYILVAEERALGDAIFMLGRAVEKGRISPAVFSKTTRSLAREWYLKKALVRKIGLGMGLSS